MSGVEGLAVGASRGHKVTKFERKAKQSRRAGRTSKRVKVIRSIIREVCGLNPFEKRMIDVLKVGAGNPDKKIYKIAKKKLGTHHRALRKREELKELYQQLKAKGM
eukprot:CAMPEP_0195516814 /NCGR_PEP_ID=MMETSP0794_2-20130614/8831_1 /TAXON_ID=515487 /ORGANISM="Stephanopyxis turris, Strain CCMP 815" /LENGTH=105 /DNA_ID=CAMNT_0040645503 /DNA_START=44 /DNA_END=361 /DNA_ORIENTATION=+